LFCFDRRTIGWLQCDYLCIWIDRGWEDIHHDGDSGRERVDAIDIEESI